MSPAWAAIIVIAGACVAITAMLFVRRRAPEGSYFADGDRAAGVFGVIAPGFSVLLGLVVFLAFESYDQSRNGGGGSAGATAVRDGPVFRCVTTDTVSGGIRPFLP